MIKCIFNIQIQVVFLNYLGARGFFECFQQVGQTADTSLPMCIPFLFFFLMNFSEIAVQVPEPKEASNV